MSISYSKFIILLFLLIINNQTITAQNEQLQKTQSSLSKNALLIDNVRCFTTGFAGSFYTLRRIGTPSLHDLITRCGLYNFGKYHANQYIQALAVTFLLSQSSPEKLSKDDYKRETYQTTLGYIAGFIGVYLSFGASIFQL